MYSLTKVTKDEKKLSFCLTDCGPSDGCNPDDDCSPDDAPSTNNDDGDKN